jgi:hypothetical protein
LTKVEMREGTGDPVTPGHSAVRKLPVSRKATNPRLTRVESVVLLLLLVALSVIVLAGVSGATHGGDVAACNANVSAVSNGLAVLRAENSGALPTPSTSTAWQRALLDRGPYVGAPFLTSWPTGSNYVITVAGAGAPKDTGDSVTPANGDVLVISVSKRLVYDATASVGAACGAL